MKTLSNQREICSLVFRVLLLTRTRTIRSMILFLSWNLQACGWLGNERCASCLITLTIALSDCSFYVLVFQLMQWRLFTVFFTHSQGSVLKPHSYWLIFGVFQVLAKALLRRLDQRKIYHCEMKFESEKELAQHQINCVQRPVSCPNEGCDAVYSATYAEAHDASCGFKLLPCFLECESSVQRKEMQNHCATVCPMKKMKCPYHSVGCPHIMAQVKILQFVHSSIWIHSQCYCLLSYIIFLIMSL